MANNSATGGYLLPLQASPPLEDAELEAVFQGYIAGVSGLPSNLVRTRWPAAGAEPPAPDQTWCLMDIRSQAADAAPAVTHDPAGEGTDSLVRHESIEVLCSMIGPRARARAAARRLGRAAEPRSPAGAGHGGDRRGAHPGRHEQVNQQWIRQYDISLRFARRVKRVYPVLNLLSAPVTTHAASVSSTDFVNHLAD